MPDSVTTIGAFAFCDCSNLHTVEFGSGITEIGENYFVIETENGEYQFNCSEETNIHHIMNRRLYRFEDLTKDMEVEVVHADAATFSLPPQSAAH